MYGLAVGSVPTIQRCRKNELFKLAVSPSVTMLGS